VLMRQPIGALRLYLKIYQRPFWDAVKRHGGNKYMSSLHLNPQLILEVAKRLKQEKGYVSLRLLADTLPHNPRTNKPFSRWNIRNYLVQTEEGREILSDNLRHGNSTPLVIKDERPKYADIEGSDVINRAEIHKDKLRGRILVGTVPLHVAILAREVWERDADGMLYAYKIYRSRRQLS